MQREAGLDADGCRTSSPTIIKQLYSVFSHKEVSAGGPIQLSSKVARKTTGRSDEHDMPSWVTHHIPVLIAATAVPVAAGLAIWWTIRHRKSAEEIERLRREHLVRHGRIIDGNILDWTEQPETGDFAVLHYRYDIAGVTYECAQDLIYLKDSVKVDTTCLGMPASVRYDPKNPANSIIVAETWSGLYQQGRE